MTKYNHTMFNPDSDFTFESGIFFITSLKDIALTPNAPKEMAAKWLIIADWLDYTGGQLSQSQLSMVGNGWKSYVATCPAPSKNLQESFKTTSKGIKESGFDIEGNLPPYEVIKIFNSLMGAEKETQPKRQPDMEAIIKDLPPLPNIENKPIPQSTSWKERLFILFAMGWAVWTGIRTYTSFNVLGFDFRPWDESYLIVHLIGPPLAIYIINRLIKWAKNEKAK